MILALVSALFLIGSFWGVCIDDYILSFVCLTLGLAVIIKFMLFDLRKCTLKPFLFGLICILMFSVGLIRGYSVVMQDDAKYSEFYNSDVLFCGDVVYISNDFKNIDVKTRWIQNDNERKYISGIIRVKNYINSDVNIKDFVTVEGKLKKFSHSRFWGDTDQKIEFAEDRILAYTSAENFEVQFNNTKMFDFTALGYFGRKFIGEKVDNTLSGQQAALLKSLLIGDRQDLSDETNKDLSLSGLMHISSVSGMHFSIFLAFIGVMFYMYSSRRKTVAILLIFTAVAYSILVGGQPSVLRSVLMVVYALIVTNLRARRDNMTSLMLSAMILCLFNPYHTHGISFQLSFLATFAIILFYDKFKKFSFGITLSVMIILTPVLAWYFNFIGFSALFTNLLAEPLILFALPLGYLMCLMPFLKFILSPLMWLMLYISKVFADFKPMTFYVATPSIYYMLIHAVLVYIIYVTLTKVNLKKILYALLVIAIICSASLVDLYRYKDCTKVSFVELGNNGAMHIETSKGNNVLINLGGSYGSLKSYLENKGIIGLDFVFFTSFSDSDSLVIEKLLEDTIIKKIFIPESDRELNDFEKAQLDKILAKTKVVYYTKGSIKLDEVQIEVLDNRQNNSKKATSTAMIKCYNTDILVGTENTEFIEDEFRSNILKSNILYISGLESYSDINTVAKAVNTKKIIISASESLPDKLLESMPVYTYDTDSCGTTDIFISSSGIKKFKTMR